MYIFLFGVDDEMGKFVFIIFNLMFGTGYMTCVINQIFIKIL